MDVDLLVGTLHWVWNRLKKSKNRMDTMLMAAAFAEAGATDIARETMSKLEEESQQEQDRG